MAPPPKLRTVDQLMKVKEIEEEKRKKKEERKEEEKDSLLSSLRKQMEETHQFLYNSGAVIDTPLSPYPSPPSDEPFQIYMKLENLQPQVKSFKVRAAMSALRSIPQQKLREGVAAPSAGNFAAGLITATQALSSSSPSLSPIPLTFLVPSHTSPAKTVPLWESGANVVLLEWEKWWELVQTQDLRGCLGEGEKKEETKEEEGKKEEIKEEEEKKEEIKEEEEKKEERKKEEGKKEEKLPCFLHPVVDTNVILGNASVGIEILKKHPDCDAIVVPVGGGALITGVCVAVRMMQDWGRPKCKVYAVEVETAAPLAPSLSAGHPVSVPYTSSWIDGMGSGKVLDEIWPFLRDWVEESLVVSLDDVAKAVEGLIKECSVVAEGAGAAPLAAITKYQNYLQQKGVKKVVGVVSGGRLSTTTLVEILKK